MSNLASLSGGYSISGYLPFYFVFTNTFYTFMYCYTLTQITWKSQKWELSC